MIAKLLFAKVGGQPRLESVSGGILARKKSKIQRFKEGLPIFILSI